MSISDTKNIQQESGSELPGHIVAEFSKVRAELQWRGSTDEIADV